MDQSKLDSFYKENYTLDRVIIGASGVEDHNQFCRMVEEKIEQLSNLDKKSVER